MNDDMHNFSGLSIDLAQTRTERAKGSGSTVRHNMYVIIHACTYTILMCLS